MGEEIAGIFWIDTHQKERLEDLSRTKRVLLSEYVQEAIEDLLEKHEEPKQGLAQEMTGAGARHLTIKQA